VTAVTALTAAAGGVPILAAAFPTVLLVGSVFVLAVSTVLMSASLSGISWPSRNRSTPAKRQAAPFDASTAARNFLGGPIQATHRPIVSGTSTQPATSRAVVHTPMVAPARQFAPSADGSDGDVAEAIALLDELYEADPQRIVNVLMQLLNETKSEHEAGRRADAGNRTSTTDLSRLGDHRS
jgi:hypothetical protein